MHKLVRRVAAAAGKAHKWWLRNDRRWGWPWRALNLVVALFVLSEIAAPLLMHVLESGRYKVDASTIALVGKTNTKLSDNLKYDPKTKAYRFNPADETNNPKVPPNKLQSHVGDATKADQNMYSVDLPVDLKKGVSYHDSSTQLGFKLTPQFSALQGVVKQGYVIYPLNGSHAQAIYTLHSNGIKEDIVMYKPGDPTMRFSYKLELPKTLEARIIPETNAIGIYSADPALFGNVSYSTDQDRANVMKAQEASSKTFLVFGLPAPIIKTSNGKPAAGMGAHYELSGSTLTVVATGLDKIKAPVSIDPTVTISSSSEFSTGGNNEGNADFITSAQVNRAAQTGPAVSGGWTSTSAFTTARSQHTTVAYNGYLYVIGGNTGSASNTVQYALICNGSNSGTGGCGATAGTVGTWTSTSSFTNARYGHTSVAYNGYLYVIGGYNGTTYYNDVQYAALNSNGSVGTWLTASTTFTIARYLHASVVYKDYLYVLGGTDGTIRSDVQYAKLKATGDVGSWTTNTNSLVDARYGRSAAAYNGYMYVLGGYNGSTNTNDTHFARINSDGSTGVWASQSRVFTTGRNGHATVVYNGYIYVMGGWNNTTYYNDVQYAPLEAGGLLGTWVTSSSFTTTRQGLAAAVYAGYLYVVGGTNGTPQNDVQYAALDAVGKPGPFASSGNQPTTAYRGSAIAAGSGYLYVIGGEAGGAPVTTVSFAQFTADGALGSWATTTALGTARSYATATAYKGWIFVSGGCTAALPTCTDTAGTVRGTIGSTGTIGAWATVTTYATPLHGHGAFIYDTRLYIVGGLSGSTYQSTVQYGLISTTGSISGWGTTSATALSVARANFGLTVYNNKLYVAGGIHSATDTACNASSSQYCSDVLYSSLITGGGNGAWSSTNSFTSARKSLTLWADRGYLYLGGGYDGSTYYSDTQYAVINSNGTVGTWTAGPSFTTGRTDMGGIINRGVFYIIGGYDGTTYYKDVQYSFIYNGGGPGLNLPGAPTNDFSTARQGVASVAYNGYLYVLGGNNGATYSASVQYAPINPGGDLGTWSPTSTFTTASSELTALAYNGYMYILGGINGSTPSAVVQYAPIITSNGTIGSWTSTTSFTTARYLHQSVVYNGYMYVIGGEVPHNPNPTPQTDVQYALICTGSNSGTGGCGATAGTVGTWNTTTALATAKSAPASVVYNGYLYVIGGYNGSGTYYSDVLYALICTGSNSGTGGCGATAGTVGTWNTTTSFSGVRAKFQAAAINGMIYIFTGDLNGTIQSDIQYATVNSDGSLALWQDTGQVITPRSLYGMAQYGGYIYMTGGANGSGTALISTESYELRSTSRMSLFTQLVNVGTTVTFTGISYGTPGSISLPIDSQSSVTYSTSDSSGNINSSGTCMGSSASIGGYAYVTIVLDDSLSTSWPDSTQTTITDYTLSYNAVHPAPNIRLHLGKTLQTGTLSPLDTCGL